MRTSCYQGYFKRELGKGILAAVAIMFSPNYCAITQSSPAAHEEELLFLHRELKLVESESLRVAVTIDALEAELHENPRRENVQQLHSQLGRLYKYDVQLYSHYKDLNEVWSYLQSPERESALARFNADQSKPIPKIHKGLYEGLPGDATPITDFSPIDIKAIYTDSPNRGQTTIFKDEYQAKLSPLD